MADGKALQLRGVEVYSGVFAHLEKVPFRAHLGLEMTMPKVHFGALKREAKKKNLCYVPSFSFLSEKKTPALPFPQSITLLKKSKKKKPLTIAYC